MLKLYRVTEQGTEYWEAWANDYAITIHWGHLGDEGDKREIKIKPGTANPNDIIKAEAEPIRAAGFEPFNPSELQSLVIQYKIEGHGGAADLDKRVVIEELINERLGWTGLGHCDGGDIGSGTMNVFCFVADAKIGESVIVRELKEHGFLEDAVIADCTDGKAKVLWPRNFKGAFSLI